MDRVWSVRFHSPVARTLLPWTLTQGPLYKWTEHSLNFHFWNYKVGGTPITPWGWMGVDGMKLDHNTTQNIHIKIFLMRGQIVFEFSWTWVLNCSNKGFFLMNCRFWLLGVELRKSISLSSLNFLEGYEKCQIWYA